VVVEVKPLRRLSKPEVAFTFDWTREAVETTLENELPRQPRCPQDRPMTTITAFVPLTSTARPVRVQQQPGRMRRPTLAHP
jgi:hypothetical protein